MKSKIRKVFVCAFVFASSFSCFALDGFLRNATVVLDKDVKDFSGTTISENIENGRSVIPSVLDLKVGDVFIDVDGCLKKVSKITKSGRSISIDTVTPSIEEAFVAVDIPEFETDFAQYEPDVAPMVTELTDEEAYLLEKQGQENLLSAARSIENTGDATEVVLLDVKDNIQRKRLLDTLMSDAQKYSITINIPFKEANTSALNELKKTLDNKIDQLANVPEGDRDSSYEEEFEALVQQRNDADKKKDNLNSKKGVGLKITPQVRYKEHEFKIGGSFEYARISVKGFFKRLFKRRGSWGYTAGHAEFYVHQDIEAGLGIDVVGTIYGSIQKSFYQYGSKSGGPYAQVGWQLGGNIDAGMGYQYYERMVKDVGGKCNIHPPLIPTNFSNWGYEWNPTIDQFSIMANGNLKTGPYALAGLYLLGIDVGAVNLEGGLKLDANISALYTRKNMDMDTLNSTKSEYIKNVWAKEIEAEKARNRGYLTRYDEIGTGWQCMGNLKLSVYAQLQLKLIKGIFSTNIFDYTRPIFSLNGWELKNPQVLEVWGYGNL